MGMNRKSLAASAVLLAAIASLPRGAAAQAGGPYQYHAITPCRIADSRYTPANPPQGSIVPANHLVTGTSICRDTSPCTESQFTVAYRMRGVTGTGNCGIPEAAKAITGNFTIVTPGAAGYIRMYPYRTADAGLPMPLTATLLFNSGDVIGNGAIVPVGDDASLTAPDLAFYILAGGTNANMVVDVTGYFCAPGPC